MNCEEIYNNIWNSKDIWKNGITMSEHVCDAIENKLQEENITERKRFELLIKSKIKLEENKNDSEVQMYFSGLLSIVLALTTLANTVLQCIFSSSISAQLSAMNDKNTSIVLESVKNSLYDHGQTFLQILSLFSVTAFIIVTVSYVWRICGKSKSEKKLRKLYIISNVLETM